jgi:hypothetical protein
MKISRRDRLRGNGLGEIPNCVFFFLSGSEEALETEDTEEARSGKGPGSL